MNPGTTLLRCASPFVFIAMSLYGLGCMADPVDSGWDPEEEELGEAELGTGGDPGTNNGLRYRVAHNHGVQRTVRVIGNAALAPSGVLPSMPDMPSPSAAGEWAGARVEFLEKLIGCALAEGTTVGDAGHIVGYMTGGGVSVPVFQQYHGEIGLAPDWRTRALTTDEKRWVTACVLSRTNRYGATIDILLGGAHPEITYRASEAYPYTVPESTVWGNMFDSTMPLGSNTDSSPAFNAYICSDVTFCSSAEGATFRACDVTYTPCGFSYMGTCSTFDAFCSEPLNSTFEGCSNRSYAIHSYLKASNATCP
ncbi:hypothetical protein [Polyangium sp. y55x31]|uniref:hypothetical protein n=1 Tax=Polyangium sp. y55x31 TaxID=3042688 RepID=UPI00248276C2|nr:hypothetical protein [Polyangium sp. y55x31]MDI1478586.1 hypothetical protein [Polyangium sp. y55x31]